MKSCVFEIVLLLLIKAEAIFVDEILSSDRKKNVNGRSFEKMIREIRTMIGTSHDGDENTF